MRQFFGKKVFIGDESSDQPKNLNNFFFATFNVKNNNNNKKNKIKNKNTKSLFTAYNKFKNFCVIKHFKMELIIKVKFVMNKLDNNK